MTIRCIDIETTGIDPAADAIVEIASGDLQRDNTITNQQVALVMSWKCPCRQRPALSNHLIDADLVAAPLIEQVIESFKGADAYIAHSFAFERSFLDRRSRSLPRLPRLPPGRRSYPRVAMGSRAPFSFLGWCYRSSSRWLDLDAFHEPSRRLDFREPSRRLVC